jgi:hypothetical protein
MKILFAIVTKQATLMRMSIVLRLLFQSVLPGEGFHVVAAATYSVMIANSGCEK